MRRTALLVPVPPVLHTPSSMRTRLVTLSFFPDWGTRNVQFVFTLTHTPAGVLPKEQKLFNTFLPPLLSEPFFLWPD